MGNKITFTRKRKQLEHLQNINEIPFFSLNGRIDTCRVVHVYDGDTIHIVIFIKNRPYKLRCRLLDLDTAEIRGSNPDEKEFAYKTRDYLTNLIFNQVIYVQFGEFDNFGRVLAHVYLRRQDIGTDKTLSNHLIQSGYGYYYDGKNKKAFCDWKNEK